MFKGCQSFRHLDLAKETGNSFYSAGDAVQFGKNAKRSVNLSKSEKNFKRTRFPVNRPTALEPAPLIKPSALRGCVSFITIKDE